MMWTDFHFLRPLWLFLLIPLLALLVGLLYSQKLDSQWQRWIDSSLLSHLLDQHQQKSNRWPLFALALAWLIATVAVAGPTWEKLPQPIIKREQSLVLLWDLSPSMLARDVKPDRLTRARYKLIDLLKAKKEGEAALVVYGGEAYTVTPLTDDMDTIINQLPALEPSLMPVSGSNSEMAVETAIKLFADSGVYAGDILLVTDGVVPAAANTIDDLMAATQHRLSVLAVGTEAGAPVPLGDGFAKDDAGKVIVDKVDTKRLRQLASDNGGRFSTLRSDNLDVDYLLADDVASLADSKFSTQDNSQSKGFDQWLERGPYLALLLLPFTVLAFRRGWILPSIALLLVNAGVAPEAQSLEWQDLWQTKDQQAYQMLQQGDAETAAETFTDKEWQASALYKNGNYDQAAKQFSDASPEGLYNKANALAQAGQLQEALANYDQALAAKPDFSDAKFNRDIVAKRLQQQQQQQQNQQGGDDQQQDQQNNQQNNQQQDKNSDQSSGDSQNNQANNDPSDQNQNGEQQNNADQSQGQNQQQAQSDEQSDADKNAEQQQADAKNSQGDKDPQQPKKNPYEDVTAEERKEGQEPGDPGQALAESDQLSEEQKQALDQWLKQVPDDPSGLLRRKFQYQYRQRRQEYRTGQWELPSNNAASRL